MWLKDNTLFQVVENPNKAEKYTRPDQISMEERLATFGQIENTYTDAQAADESARCLKCPTHWCQKQCPAGVPVTDFIAAARAEDYEKAYEIIRSASMMPEMCSRVCPQEKQCQSNCTRSIRNDAVRIGKLERYVVEQHYASGQGEKKAPATGKKVAVIGSGPAGLSAAQRLLDQGHSVTVYERADRAGGLLEYGIPNMKLEKGIVERKIKSLEDQGAVIKCNVNVGVDLKADQLKKDYDAVIIAAGTRNARALSLDDAEGIVAAVDFLTENTMGVLAGQTIDTAKDKNVIIVGGGDTGNDCVGTSLRQGAKTITQIEMMPEKTGRTIINEAHPGKAPEAKHDFSQEECKEKLGDPHIYQATVKSVEKDGAGNLKSVTTIDLKARYDEKFRIVLDEIPGSEKTYPCDLMIVAAGFIGPEAYIAEAFGCKTDGRTDIDASDYQVEDSVFACGDCRTGQSLVVKAMSDGRDCADRVNAYLSK